MRKYDFDIKNRLENSSMQIPVYSETTREPRPDDRDTAFARAQERFQLSRVLGISETDAQMSSNYWKIESSDDDDEVVIKIGNLNKKKLTQLKIKVKEEVVESRALHITNLVRPFTLGQLTALLSQTGTFDREKGFWINHIRSHCYVIYHTVKMARRTMEALHNRQWPDNSPKRLNVEYVLEDSKSVQLLLRPLKSIEQQIQEENCAALPPEKIT